jgi:Ca2+-binding EF-hand superfamily protein
VSSHGIPYDARMTELLEEALRVARQLPANGQDEIARAMLALMDNEADAEEINPAHLSDILESLAQAKRGDFATESEVEAAFRRFDR